MRSASFILPILLLVAAGCDRASTDNSVAKKSPAIPALVPLTNMILVGAGTFVHQSNVVSGAHDFWLGKLEVTQAEFSALLGRNPSHFQGDANRPVEKVSFLDASAYCAALTKRERTAGRLPPGLEYRLPTEAEWELACRAGSTNRFSFGDAPADADAFAWTAENSDAITHPVGLKQPNSWGFHDMHGNVWEWCLDWFDPAPGMASNPHVGKQPGPRTFKIFKGGGWNQDAEFAGAANKFMMEPDKGIHFVGFRIALGPPATENTAPPANR